MKFLNRQDMMLDEAQGLTDEMAFKSVTGLGWKQSETGHLWFKLSPEGVVIKVTSGGDADVMKHTSALRLIAECEGITLQALLRKINPRLCPWPSKEAREEHRGPWLAVCTEDGTACMGRFRPDVAWFKHTGEHILTSEDSFVRFWPCDESGNKVRWPTNAAGEML
jgi:hypothetical protein